MSMGAGFFTVLGGLIDAGGNDGLLQLVGVMVGVTISVMIVVRSVQGLAQPSWHYRRSKKAAVLATQPSGIGFFLV